MELLLDTHTLLWALLEPEKLPDDVKTAIEDINNDIFISTASLLEIEIKHDKNDKLMPYSALDIYNAIIEHADYILLDIRPEYLFKLKEIKDKGIHKDPFDHLLLNTAKIEGFYLVTCDKNIQMYKGISIISY